MLLAVVAGLAVTDGVVAARGSVMRTDITIELGKTKRITLDLRLAPQSLAEKNMYLSYDSEFNIWPPVCAIYERNNKAEVWNDWNNYRGEVPIVSRCGHGLTEIWDILRWDLVNLWQD